MALLVFVVLGIALALVSLAGWGSDSRKFADWPAVRDGDRQPLPKL